MLCVLLRRLQRLMTLAAMLQTGGVWAVDVTWAVVDWPPMFMGVPPTGTGTAKDIGQGAVDQVMRQLIDRTPQYNHRIELHNRQRIWAAMEQGRNLCYAAALPSPEREKVAYLYPVTATPPLALATTATTRQIYLKGLAVLPWSKISTSLPIGGGLESGRNYGKDVEQSLTENAIYMERYTVATTGELLKPLAAGRVSYILEYPMVVSYANLNELAQHPVSYIPIEGLREWQTVYLACTRNAWGHGVMLDLSAAIRAAAASPQFRAVTKNWLDKDYYERSAPQIQEVFDRIARTPQFR